MTCHASNINNDKNWVNLNAQPKIQILNSLHTFADPAAGASDDWYKGVLKARFAYTVELRDTGRHGFVLPADQIKPSGEELWEAQRVVLQKMVDVSSE